MKLNRIVNELSELVKHNVISSEVASSITEYYKSKKEQQPNRLFTIFGVLGSVLVGLGIILILAHNWDNFSRLVKICFAFLPLLLGQIVSSYTILKKKKQAWKESSGTFLFFAIGASIALISQVYNIPGNLSRFLLTWIVLGLPLIYVLNSKAVAMLVIVFSSYYAYELGYNYGFQNKTPWLYLVLILSTIPFYVKLLKSVPKANSTSVFNWLFVLSLILALGTFVNSNENLGFLMYVMLFGVFYNLGKLPIFNNQQLRRNSYILLGSLGMIVLLLILSFNVIWKEMGRKLITLQSQELVITIALFGVALALLIYSKKFVKNSKFNLFQFAFLLVVIVFPIGLNNPNLGVIFTNILVVALGLFTIKIGADAFRFSVLNYGLLIITAVIACRFFDISMSFVLRGLLFVGVGISFYLINYVMHIKQKEKLRNEGF